MQKSHEVVNEKKYKLFPDIHFPYILSISYPQQFQEKKLEEKLSKFLDILKKLHINIQFADSLEQMLSYEKFMKEILSNKRKLEKHEIVALIE